MSQLIGVPRETEAGEKRVATVPEVVEKLIKLGFRVNVQSGAGEGANFSDEAYRAAGAEVVADVWDKAACHGGTHVSEPERLAFARLCAWGLVDAYRLHHPDRGGRYTWWDYRAGNFHKNFGMRIDHLLVTAPVAARTRWAEIDREARKGKPVPSDHAPLVIDLDEPGAPFDAGWTGAEARIAGRVRSGGR